MGELIHRQYVENSELKKYRILFGQFIVVSWFEALSKEGQFLGCDSDIVINPGEDKQAWKRIVYTFPNGIKMVADPYKPGRILLKDDGSPLILQMIAGYAFGRGADSELTWTSMNVGDAICDVDTDTGGKGKILTVKNFHIKENTWLDTDTDEFFYKDIVGSDGSNLAQCFWVVSYTQEETPLEID